jgi:glutathione S-transferase
MLKLYHGPAAANGLKVLIALHEKALDFQRVYLDLHRFEQHEPWYVAINPDGQVPTLVHDGFVLTQSSVINEYLEDAFPDAPALRPRDAQGAARTRGWNKYIDENYMEAVSMHGWKFRLSDLTRQMDPAEFETYMQRIPLERQRRKWRAVRAGFPDEALAAAIVKVGEALDRLELQLTDTPWLAGGQYTLADVNFFATGGNSIERLFPQLLAGDIRPRFRDWLGRINARPAVQAALATPAQ